MMTLQEEIQSERERLKSHQEQIVQLEQREGYLKRARDENVVLLKGVTQTLDKCIQKLKRGMKRNKEKEGGKERGEERGETPTRKDGESPSSGHETLFDASDDIVMTATDATTNTNAMDNENDDDHKDEGDTHQTETAMIPKTPLTPIPTDPSNSSSKRRLLHPPDFGTVRINSCSVFDEEYMKKRWGQTHPNDNAIFHFSRHEEEEKHSMLPLHRPLASVDLLKKMMMISQKEVMARRSRGIEGYMSSSPSPCEGRDLWIQKDYNDTVKGTILDIDACSHYDPHLFEALRRVKVVDGEGANALLDEKNAMVMGPRLEFKPKIHEPPVINSNSTITTASINNVRRIEINPNQIICRKALFGKCNDAYCSYQHLSGRFNLKTKSNKLRTIETNQHALEVMLPIHSCPFPPPPTADGIIQKRQEHKDQDICMDGCNNDDYENPEGGLNRHHQGNQLEEARKKRRVDRREEEEAFRLSMVNASHDIEDVNGSEGQRKDCGEEVAYRSVCEEDNDSSMSLNNSNSEKQKSNEKKSGCKVEESDSNMSLNSSDSEKQDFKGQYTSLSEEIAGGNACEDDNESNMSLTSNESEKQGLEGHKSNCNEEDSCRSVSDEDNESYSPPRQKYLADDENYIKLPALDTYIDEAQVSSAINNILSESDNNIEDVSPSLQNLDSTVASNDKHQDLSSIYEALASIGFEVASEANDGESSYLIRYKYPLTFLPGVIFEDLFRQTLLLNSIVSGVQLCIHAGRVDLSKGILDFGSDGNFSEDYSIPLVLKESHFFIIKSVLDTLARLSEGSTCGRGTQSPNSIFHIQLFLAALSHVTQNYLETLTSQNVDSMDELEVYVTDVANNLQIAIQTLFHDTAPAVSGNEKFFALVTQLETSLNAMSNLTEVETCRKLSDFVALGQKIAMVAADMVFQLDDPQLVIENILFALVTTLKLCSNGRLLGLPSREINVFRNTYWSAKSAKQVAIFNLFGPGIFTSISGIVHLMKKESSRSMAFCSRNEGIWVQLKQLLMQSIQYLDFSGIISNNIEGQLLLCPFFGMLANVLFVCHSYTLTHVLLVNALYTAHTAKNWAVYSDLLWSQLLQLHATFPPLKTEDMTLTSELVKLPLKYGTYPSKFSLQGDNALVNLVALETSVESSVHDKFLERMDQIKSLCMQLSLSNFETKGFAKNDLTAITINLEGKTASLHLAPSLGEFPMSFCIMGSNLRLLHLQNCRLASVPVTFGDWFPLLEVSKLQMSQTFFV